MPRATDVGREDTKDADETYQGLYCAVSIIIVLYMQHFIKL